MWILLLFVYVCQVVCTDCILSNVDCQEFTCTRDAFNGQVVNEAACPFRRFGNTTRRVCTACSSGQTCMTNGICRDNDEVFPGKPCSSDEECSPFVPDITRYPYTCNGGICGVNKTNSLYANDGGCGSTADCYGNTLCDNGVCVENTICTEDKECAGNRYCFGGLCSKRVLGAVGCLETTNCASSEMCIRGVCEPRFSIFEDEWCNQDDTMPDFSCVVGLQCINNLYSTKALCRNTPSNLIPDTCDYTRAGECPLGYTCACDPNTNIGKCFPDRPTGSCASQWKSYFVCTFGAKCREEHFDFIAPGMCAYENCFKEWARLQSCRYEELPNSIKDQDCEVTRLANIRAGNIIVPFEPEGDAAAELPILF